MPSNSASSSRLNDTVRSGFRIAKQRGENRAGQECFVQRHDDRRRLFDARQVGRRARDFLQHAGVAKKFLQLLAQFDFFRFRLPVRFHAARFSG